MVEIVNAVKGKIVDGAYCLDASVDGYCTYL